MNFSKLNYCCSTFIAGVIHYQICHFEPLVHFSIAENDTPWYESLKSAEGSSKPNELNLHSLDSLYPTD